MTFTGGKELARALAALPDAVSINVQRKALRLAAEPMRAEAAALAPRGPDAPHIADNIIIAVPTGKLEDVSDDAAVVAVGPEKSYFYGFFWEFGWRYHAAHPFMRPAFDGKADESLSIIGRELWASIQKASARLFAQQSALTSSNRARSSGGGLL